MIIIFPFYLFLENTDFKLDNLFDPTNQQNENLLNPNEQKYLSEFLDELVQSKNPFENALPPPSVNNSNKNGGFTFPIHTTNTTQFTSQKSTIHRQTYPFAFPGPVQSPIQSPIQEQPQQFQQPQFQQPQPIQQQKQQQQQPQQPQPQPQQHQTQHSFYQQSQQLQQHQPQQQQQQQQQSSPQPVQHIQHIQQIQQTQQVQQIQVQVQVQQHQFSNKIVKGALSTESLRQGMRSAVKSNF